MKTRNSFVSNSSSSSFIITNTTGKPKSLYDFAKENDWLVSEYNETYRDNIEIEDILEEAKNINVSLKPGKNLLIFGDEQGTKIGCVYDYVLRDGGISESFKWCFYESLR